MTMHLSEIDAMNLLQDHGVVSDRAVWLSNVHDEDQPKARKWLQDWYHEKKYE